MGSNIDELLHNILNVVFEIRDDVKELKERVSALEQRMDALEQRVGALEQRMDALENRMDNIEGDVKNLKEEVSKNSTGIHEIKFLLENDYSKRINIIAEGHSDLDRRLKDNQNSFAMYEDLVLRVQQLETKFDSIKFA